MNHTICVQQNFYSAITNKLHDGFVQYALAWLTHKMPFLHVLPCWFQLFCVTMCSH